MKEDLYNYDSFRRAMMKEDTAFDGGAAPGDPAPDFELPTIRGDRFRLSDERGKHPVLIEFGSIT